MGFGALIAGYGILLWYEKKQKPEDDILQLDLAERRARAAKQPA
jgi:hypothetical protein